MKDRIIFFIILMITICFMVTIPRKINENQKQEPLENKQETIENQKQEPLGKKQDTIENQDQKPLEEQEQTIDNQRKQHEETWNQISDGYNIMPSDISPNLLSEAELEYLMELENRLSLYDQDVSNEQEVTGQQYSEDQNANAKDYKVVGQKKEHAYESKYPDLYAENNLPLELDINNKTAFLTFDDGPSKNTQKILEILDKYQIKASFFVITGNMSETGEELLKQMADEGHAIGIHSSCHEARVIYRSVDSFLDDFYLAYSKIKEITDAEVCTYRFPWGSYNGYLKPIKRDLIEEMERRGFSYIDWNVSGEDSIGCPTKYSILKSIKRDLDRYSYPVILLHDSPSNELTVKVLPDVIELLQSKGYRFGTIYERTPYQFTW